MYKTHTDLWADCLKIIRKDIGDDQYSSWFRDITSLSFENNVLRLLVPSAFFVEYIEGKYIATLAKAIHAVYGPDVQLHYNYNVVGNEPETCVDVKQTPRSNAVPMRPGENPFQMAVTVKDIDSHLNPRYTFENYCCSQSNKDALAIALSIADNPSVKTFNPLFLFGQTGVGKTHLIQAIGIRIKERNPKARVLYVTARDFESQFTTSIIKKETNKFFSFYQSIDTLIVDDVQDLNNKPGTQNSFFNIFNHLHLNSRQIILSSDRSPAEMEGFEARLLGRFKWGMSLALEKPDRNLRREVLAQKAAHEGVDLSDDVIEFIADNVTESIRDLEGIMVSLVAHATVMSKPISLDLAKMVVGNAVRVRPRQINFEIIAREVAAYYGVNSDLIFTKSRKREISDARQITMYLAKRLAGMPLTAIGHRIGRSHATVIYAVRHIEERIDLEKSLRDEVSKIEAAILS